eukprot:Mycagemm_TRINITY_DN10339_c3_g5::TRINITY_DN10339_c3_g5_i2::g.969::m.969 type:complete len:183 gc:universal TRINITY_DN10339_c3_g5_i2:1278-730(-)
MVGREQHHVLHRLRGAGGPRDAVGADQRDGLRLLLGLDVEVAQDERVDVRWDTPVDYLDLRLASGERILGERAGEVQHWHHEPPSVQDEVGHDHLLLGVEEVHRGGERKHREDDLAVGSHSRSCHVRDVVALLDPLRGSNGGDKLARNLLKTDDVGVRCLKLAQNVRNAVVCKDLLGLVEVV